MSESWQYVLGRWICLVGCVVLAGGCASTKVDWNSRIGHVTFDEMVIEIGPPDKQARLQDGTMVAEWMTQRAMRTMTVVGGYYPGTLYTPADVIYVDRYSPDYYLRLTFGPDGKL